MTDLQVSKTILSQLGGHRFVAMTGAHGFIGSDRALSFKVARKCMRIVLDDSDTYTVALYTRTGREMRKVSDVYADRLQAVFTDLTGLYTHF